MKEPIYRRRFDYDRNLLPNKYLARLETGVRDIGSAIEKTGYSVGYPGWNLLYYTLFTSLRENEENIILETGTNFGSSTIILAQALADSGYVGKIHTVEIDDDNYQKAIENIDNAGLSNYVDLNKGESVDFLRKFVESGKIIRFAFLDGGHMKQQVIDEFEIIYPFLDNSSIIFFDNTYHIDEKDGRVYAAIREIYKKYGGNIINFENTSWYTPGQAIWQKNAFDIQN